MKNDINDLESIELDFSRGKEIYEKLTKFYPHHILEEKDGLEPNVLIVLYDFESYDDFLKKQNELLSSKYFSIDSEYSEIYLVKSNRAVCIYNPKNITKLFKLYYISDATLAKAILQDKTLFSKT